MDSTTRRVAIVCDWLKDWGGAEQVIYDILELFPDADIFTSVFDPKNFPELQERNIYTSFLQKIPFLRSRPKMIPFLRTYAFESFDLSKYDIVLSSASAEAKGIITRPETLHVCYCHTPTRYYWSHTHEYQKHLEFGWFNLIARIVLPLLLHSLRKWDYLAAQRVDIFLANSRVTANRIKKYYRRDSHILNP
jgi:hypothetical protein